MDHKFAKLLSICLLAMLNTQLIVAEWANITFVESAISKGAVCLDGSPPAYAHTPGFGSGVNSWLLYLEGGAWCESTSECLSRSIGWLGNSYSRKNRTFFDGLLTNNQTYNRDFYNWNKVYLIYCDGSSFLGDVEEVDPQSKLTYRGSRVFNAIMDELLPQGMSTAENVILSGSSAGGLATILHCDSFRALVPNAKRVKCISDSGFFIHGKNLPGAKEREIFFTEVVKLHQLEKLLPASCASKMNPGLCLFPEYLVENIQTPLFILESSFDSHQLNEMITPYIGGGKPEWNDCLRKNIALCNSTQLKIMEDFQNTFIQTLQNLKYSASRGMFVHSFYLHGHITTRETSTCSAVVNNVLNDKSVAEAIGDWYFDRTNFQQIDSSHKVPLNSSSTLDTVTFCKEWVWLEKSKDINTQYLIPTQSWYMPSNMLRSIDTKNTLKLNFVSIDAPLDVFGTQSYNHFRSRNISLSAPRNKDRYKTCKWRFDEDSAYIFDPKRGLWNAFDYSPNYESLNRGGGVVKGYFRKLLIFY